MTAASDPTAAAAAWLGRRVDLEQQLARVEALTTNPAAALSALADALMAGLEPQSLRVLASPVGARVRPSAEYLAGARREAELTVQGMTSSGREVYDFVRIVAQQGRSASDIAEEVAVVFTAGWMFRYRRRLAWRLLRGR